MLMYHRLLKRAYVHIVVGLFFGGVLAVGLSVYDDYGLSWDDEGSRTLGGISALYVNARLNHLFLSEEAVQQVQAERRRSEVQAYGEDEVELNDLATHYYDDTSLSWHGGSDHGVFFEMFLIAAEWLLDRVDSREVYLMRHLLTFMIFYVGVIYFYLLLYNRFMSWKVGLLGCALLLASPRIFAHSFYNSKDLGFLSFYIITTYSMVRFLEKRNFRSAFCHALTTAMVIAIRMPGLIVPVVTFFFYGVTLSTTDIHRSVRKHVTVLAFHTLFLVGFVILFWPYLWEDPLGNFIEAFARLSKYPWEYGVLYMGKTFKASELPWHYLLVWIVITTPILYTVGFLIGVAILGVQLILNPRKALSDEKTQRDYVLLSLCLLPLVAVIGLRSTVYDGWRHVFFIYPGFIYISVRGFVGCKEAAANRLHFLNFTLVRILGVLILLFGIGSPLWYMVRYHPFQNVYFNILAGESIETRFERDYWGLSYRQALEHILEIDEGETVKVCPADRAAKMNAQILPKNSRRLKFVPLEEATYFVSNYRHDSQRKAESLGWVETYAIKVKDFKVVGVFEKERRY